MPPKEWKPIHILPVAAKAAAMFDLLYRSLKSKEPGDVMAVEYLNYGALGGVQILSLVETRVKIENILINDEFRPSLFAPYQEGRGGFARQGLPRSLRGYGTSLIVITDAPFTPPQMRSYCYGKPVTKVEISTTNQGDFVFGIDETAYCDKPHLYGT